ncbi:hypothetical protein GYMLUDRAFT_266242 [Collybiopsis luxurians FD-317 M1]|uniref:Uncharacterized protein n=1 Tax=Collybiopsis luxurians FD-317 M1 TaxID=944289 RepID=A0A0D0C5X1_9AGAR|nr:hypothetical protein GYMLUDRAFT_266242 [Collybiopsis luxurians FD-317 M1]
MKLIAKLSCFTLFFFKALSAPPVTTVTFYDVVPSQSVSIFESTSNTSSFDGTFELTTAIVGVNSGSAGSETTYSFGEYYSENIVQTITGIDSKVQVTTQTIVGLLNCELASVTSIPESHASFKLIGTIVESDGGEWITGSPKLLTDGIANGEYRSCSYDLSHSSAFCTGVDLEPVLTTVTSGSQIATVTEAIAFSSHSYGGSIVATTAALPVNTGFSNTAMRKGQESGMGGYIILFLLVKLYNVYL